MCSALDSLGSCADLARVGPLIHETETSALQVGLYHPWRLILSSRSSLSFAPFVPLELIELPGRNELEDARREAGGPLHQIQLVVVLDELTLLRKLLPGHVEQMAEDVSVRAGVAGVQDAPFAVPAQKLPHPGRPTFAHLSA